MSRPRVTLADPRVPELIRLYESGLSIPSAARRVKLGAGRAAQLLRQSGVTVRVSEPWPAERLAVMRSLRRAGKNWAAIGAALGCLPDTARKMYQKHIAPVDRAEDQVHVPPPHTVIGPMTERPATLAQRVAAEVERLGAVVLLQHRGRYITAVPGSAVAQAAEVDRAVVGTYVDGVEPSWIAEDIEGACA